MNAKLSWESNGKNTARECSKEVLPVLHSALSSATSFSSDSITHFKHVASLGNVNKVTVLASEGFRPHRNQRPRQYLYRKRNKGAAMKAVFGAVSSWAWKALNREGTGVRLHVTKEFWDWAETAIYHSDFNMAFSDEHSIPRQSTDRSCKDCFFQTMMFLETRLPRFQHFLTSKDRKYLCQIEHYTTLLSHI